MAERVQKILSQWGIASRRQAEKMILAGRVNINGQKAKLGDKVDLTTDLLTVDQKLIKVASRPQLIYLLLNKPLGVVSTCKDPQNRPTVLDLIPLKLKQGQGIHPVGRLDVASSGALLLTNDGDLTLNLTHPRYHLPKTYHVWLDGQPTANDLAQWRKGIILSQRKTLPAKVKVIKQQEGKTLIEVILVEGRNRQIRRIAEQLGFKVTRLHRLAIGSLSLYAPKHKPLSPGKYRTLTDQEVKSLKSNFIKKPV